MISQAPTYDKYGKELSNYDKWRVQHGENVNSFDLNHKNYTGEVHGYSSNLKPQSSQRKSRIEDDIFPSMRGNSSANIFNSTNRRELSVMPRRSFEKELTASLPSRFANLTTRDFNTHNTSTSNGQSSSFNAIRGQSMVPSSHHSKNSTSSHSYSAIPYGKSTSDYPKSLGRSSKSNLLQSSPSSINTKLAGYNIQDVKGDGGCYYRCLSVYFTGCEDNYNKYRQEVVGYIYKHMDNYSSMIKSEIGYSSTNNYFSRKMRTDHQEFAETTEIIATCCLYNINVHVLALIPGKHTWEWLHFDPSIGSGKPSTADKDIYLYNQGSIHFMLCSPK